MGDRLGVERLLNWIGLGVTCMGDAAASVLIFFFFDFFWFVGDDEEQQGGGLRRNEGRNGLSVIDRGLSRGRGFLRIYE